MRLPFLVPYAFLLCVFSSFNATQPCAYADSNIGYVKGEIEKAMLLKDFQMVRFRTYKALNAIERSKKQLEQCGCKYAEENIYQGSEHLKQATKTTSLAGSVMLLQKALDQIEEGIEELNSHEQHDSAYGNEQLSMNTVVKQKTKALSPPATETPLRQKIDTSLTAYRRSLEKVIETVDCKEARKYAERIYDHCEQQLLRPNLSEGKMYYNLMTKKITAEALEKLGACKD